MPPGLILRTRAAHLLARAALSIVVLAVAVKAAGLYAGGGAPAYPDERLVAHVYLLGFALAAAAAVGVFLLLRRTRSVEDFGGAISSRSAGWRRQ